MAHAPFLTAYMAVPEERGLENTAVLVTRPAAQAESLAALIELAGGEAVRFPVLEILDPVDSAALQRIVDRLDEFDMAIFISPNAVNKAMNVIRSRRPLPARLKLACVGRGSARELKHFGQEDVIAPTGRFDSEALLDLPALADIAGQRIVIFRGDGGREVLGETLQHRGASVEYAECYRRGKPQVDTTALLRRWARGGIDVVTVTSVQSLRNLYDLVGKLGQQWLVKTPIVVISDRMVATCRELGFKGEPLIAPEASDEAIVKTIRAWRAAQKSL